MAPVTRAIKGCAVGLILGSTGWAQVTQRVSVNSDGAQGNGYGSGNPCISADGRFVAFMSWSTNLVPGDTNGVYDVFVRDRQRGTTERVSVDTNGVQANDYSNLCSISADGRYVVFCSPATSLVPGDTNGTWDVFVRDRQSGTTELVSLNSSGVQGDLGSGGGSISADGRYVAFISSASNLVPGYGFPGLPDVFVRDRVGGTTENVSIIPGVPQQPSDIWGMDASISADGRCVAFSTYANDQVPGDTDGLPDVFVRDRQTGTIECVSIGSGGVQGGRSCGNASLSADGRYVAFQSLAANLVPGDTNTTTDVFVRDRLASRTERVSVDSHGVQSDDASYLPMISADGRYVTFESKATNLVGDDTNLFPDVFVHDRRTGTTERVNLKPSGAQDHISGYGLWPAISADGRFVAFDSYADDLVPGDTNGIFDVFVRDRNHRDFASLCEPRVSGVIDCPCSNPPSGPEQGCDNSSGTGGASLSISGGEYLSSDTLFFTTNGETPDALSMVLQGTTAHSSGVIYGQGVRCVGGVLKRLYTRTASGGTVTVPNFDAGETTVHERSASLGDPIQAGITRRYFVIYRAPIVLGGCPASSTFNATQAREVTWAP